MKTAVKRIMCAAAASVVILLCACSAGHSSTPDEAATHAPTEARQLLPTSAPTEPPDLTSVHGYYSDKDHAEIHFRGQAYYNVVLWQGQLILGDLSAAAYITSTDITDDEEAAEEGAAVYFDPKQTVPDILVMSTADYYKGENYDPDYHTEYQYFCKKEQWSIYGQKLRTASFPKMYVTYWEVGSMMGFTFASGGHEMLDDSTADVIQRTVKSTTDDRLYPEDLENGGFLMFIAHRCDKNMLVDPLTDEYIMVFTDDMKLYIGDWYSDGLMRADDADVGPIYDLFTKYDYTVKLQTAYYISRFIENKNEISDAQAV